MTRWEIPSPRAKSGDLGCPLPAGRGPRATRDALGVRANHIGCKLRPLARSLGDLAWSPFCRDVYLAAHGRPPAMVATTLRRSGTREAKPDRRSFAVPPTN